MESFETILKNDNAMHTRRIMSYQYLKNVSLQDNKYGIHSEHHNDNLYHILDQDMMISILQYNLDQNVKVSMYTNSEQMNWQLNDTSNPLHCNDFIELTYVLQGELTVLVANEIHKFHENELYLISPHIPYQEKKELSNAVVFNISIKNSHFDEMLLSNIRENSLQSFLHNCLLREVNSQKMLSFSSNTPKDKETVNELISNIFWEYNAQKPGYLFIVKGNLIRLLDFLACHYHFVFSESTKHKHTEYLFQEVSNYMKENFLSIRMQDLTDQFHYQNNYFNKLIHSFTGMSYSEYLISIRLDAAKELLEKTDASIEEIMLTVGYHNKGFFYSKFKEQFGMTPAVFRKQL